jgi:integrase
MPDQLPSGRWRARVRHPRTGRQITAHTVIGGPASHADADDAAAAERQAAGVLRSSVQFGVTVAEFRADWTTSALWLRPAESTNLHNAERSAKFAESYADRPMRSIDDDVVVEWLRGGRNLGTVPALRAMFNDAMTAQAGRLVALNPFARLGLKQSRGRRNVQPPTQVGAARLIELADELTPPSFAAYLHFEIYEGTRPGEADGLRCEQLDFQAGTVLINQQWNAKVRKFTPPKHGVIRTIAMTDPARERLLSLPRESEFVFTTTRGSHYTASARSHHWNRVRAAAGLGNMDLYTCTRHYFAWYAWNVLGLEPEHIADHFGHQDGGELVRRLYGHFDSARSRACVRDAFATAPAAPVPLRRLTTQEAAR